MKRIKTVNGYTIYQAVTERGARTYGIDQGNYNIYLAADVRDYGLTNSYPEWDNIDSMAECVAHCNGSCYAVACELAEELSGSTAQDMDLVRQIEARLEAGESLQEVAEDLSRQLDIVFPDDYQWELHVDEADDELLDGDLEDVFDRAMGAEVVVEDRPFWEKPNQYLAVITWEDTDEEPTSYRVMQAHEIFDRIDMYDCYDEDLSLWLLTPEGPQPCDWHGTWHDPNDPLKMSITLRSTGNVLDLGWGTDH